ncbi:MAG: ABC transporter permease [Candidatus Delongbacteria bacterium]|jgi:ABC-2 type transport system permease protein|nr:ABC transporter permease [Candidatus Delongbacteria bacterium]
MKRFLALLKKEYLHIFRDMRTLMILFGMPIVQILIFGYVIKNEVKDVDIAVLDYAHDEYSIELRSKIQASGYLNIVDELQSSEQIHDAFKRAKVSEVIVFPNDLANDLQKDNQPAIQLILDATDPNYAQLIGQYTEAILLDYAVEMSAITPQQESIKLENRMVFNEELESSFMFVPGTMAFILMLLSALMSSITIAREKETGSMEVLLVSSLKPLQVVLGKVMPYVILAFVNAVSVILVGNIVFGVPIEGSVILLMLVSVLFVITSLALGIMISTIADKQFTAMMMSMLILMLPTMLLSGFIFPIENMPEVLQWLSCIIPARWYLEIIKSIMLKGAGIAFIWQQVLILTGMFIVTIAISVKNYKLRLE